MAKTLLITGGASGIGAETARRAASRGYNVAINYRSRDAQARKLVADIEAMGAKAIALPADMASEADIVKMFEETTKQLGPITHLLNSAGISSGRSRVDAYDLANLTKLFAVNVTGLMLCCREAAKRMSTRNGGKVAPSSTSRRWPRRWADGRARRPMPPAKGRSMPSRRPSHAKSRPKASGSIRCAPAW